MEKDLEKILLILIKRHENHFASKATRSIRIQLEIMLVTSYFENRLVYKKNEAGQIQYFFIFIEQYRGDLNDTFIVFTHIFCTKNIQIISECINEIKKVIKQSNKKIRKALVTIDVDQVDLTKYFQKKGILSAVELVGSVGFGLKKLSQKKKNPFLRIKKLVAKDIKYCIRRDIDSHVNEPSSRMRERFSAPDAPKMMRTFYKGLVSNEQGLKVIIKESNKEVIVGMIGYFVDKKRSTGMIAAIYVDRSYQKMGISSFLYLSILKKFKLLGLKHYVGSSTTIGVLKLAKSIGRKEVSRLWIFEYPTKTVVTQQN